MKPFDRQVFGNREDELLGEQDAIEFELGNRDVGLRRTCVDVHAMRLGGRESSDPVGRRAKGRTMATEQDILEQSTPQDLFRFLVAASTPKRPSHFGSRRSGLAMLERVVTEDVDQLDTRLDGLQAMAQWLNEEMAKRVEKIRRCDVQAA